jgi:hypothetical protein
MARVPSRSTAHEVEREESANAPGTDRRFSLANEANTVETHLRLTPLSDMASFSESIGTSSFFSIAKSIGCFGALLLI